MQSHTIKPSRKDELLIECFVNFIKREHKNPITGTSPTEEWIFDFHPDIESLHIKWNKPLDVETKINNYKHSDSSRYIVEKGSLHEFRDRMYEALKDMDQQEHHKVSEDKPFNGLEVDKEKFKFDLKKYLKNCDIGILEFCEPSIVWIENYDTDELHIKWRKKPLEDKPMTYFKYKVDTNGVKSYVGEFTLKDIVGTMCESFKENEHTVCYPNVPQESKSIKELLMDLKFIDKNPLYFRAYEMYDIFQEAALDDNTSQSLTRSFLKYFYESDSWRVRMNDVWAEWDEFLLDTEDEREKVKNALKEMYHQITKII